MTMDPNQWIACIEICSPRIPPLYRKWWRMIVLYQIYLRSRVSRRPGNLCCPVWISKRASKSQRLNQPTPYIVILLGASDCRARGMRGTSREMSRCAEFWSLRYYVSMCRERLVAVEDTCGARESVSLSPGFVYAPERCDRHVVVSIADQTDMLLGTDPRVSRRCGSASTITKPPIECFCSSQRFHATEKMRSKLPEY